MKLSAVFVTAVFVTLVLAAGCGGGESPNDEESDCTSSCETTVDAACDSGPTLSECVSDCMALLEGDCSAEFSALVSCGAAADVTCDPDGFPLVEGCAAEQDAFVACLGG